MQPICITQQPDQEKRKNAMPGKAPVLIILMSLLLLFAQPGYASERLPVFVSIVPQKYFLEQIGKDLVDVQIMVTPGASPAAYEPKPKQMADLAKTELYFAIGVPFEKAWLDKIAAANPEMKIVHTDRDIEKLPMATHHHHDAEESNHGEAHHSENEQSEKTGEKTVLDPHIWLSPPLVKMQAQSIRDALINADPAHSTAYEANFREFSGRIDRLDAELKKLFSDVEGLQFMVFHPAWGYFAHAYGLTQVPVEVEGKEPKPAQLAELIRHAREHDIRVVFVQPQFSSKSAELVAREIGGRVAVADPLAEAWMDNLRTLSETFKSALR
jgi:zinc transport system substrate-binding protein